MGADSPGAGGPGGTATCAGDSVIRQGRQGAAADPGSATLGGDGGRGAEPARQGIIELPGDRSTGGGGGGGGGNTVGTEPGGAGALGSEGYAVVWW
ncbi:hypothetical protein [Streptomyces sp. H34-S4]|uniref:hypothetical protein n=1 Tax=Streptomyces sp. H34-S4 TaxID=2996463 RepID=UPI002270D447|nr:hypothetical protein [Streptomyces sp. H34-S4]MCY0938164.1 hypothetical protein [Streptomyces sp. H34-S4]